MLEYFSKETHLLMSFNVLQHRHWCLNIYGGWWKVKLKINGLFSHITCVFLVYLSVKTPYKSHLPMIAWWYWCWNAIFYSRTWTQLHHTQTVWEEVWYKPRKPECPLDPKKIGWRWSVAIFQWYPWWDQHPLEAAKSQDQKIQLSAYKCKRQRASCYNHIPRDARLCVFLRMNSLAKSRISSHILASSHRTWCRNNYSLTGCTCELRHFLRQTCPSSRKRA